MHFIWLITDEMSREFPHTAIVPDGRYFANHRNLQTALTNAVFYMKYSWA